MLWQWRGLNSGPCAHKTNTLPLRWISNPKSFFTLKVEWWIRNHQLRPPQLVDLLTQPRSVPGTVYPIPTALGPLPYIHCLLFYSRPLCSELLQFRVWCHCHPSSPPLCFLPFPHHAHHCSHLGQNDLPVKTLPDCYSDKIFQGLPNVPQEEGQAV